MSSVAETQTSAPADNVIFCDLTMVIRDDLRTGIERAARAIAGTLSRCPPPGFSVEITSISGEGPLFARDYQQNVLGQDVASRPRGSVVPRAGDHYLLLDWAPDRLPLIEAWLHRFRAAGGTVTAVVYDLLPLEHPHFFPDWLRHTVSDWLSLLLRVADNIVCISRSVCESFAHLSARRLPDRVRPISLGYFHLGFDIEASEPTSGSTSNEADVLAKIGDRPTFLMVGTVEPRKGHAQILEAFDVMWKDGVDVGLIVVGKEGWMVNALTTAIKEHREAGERLFWLPKASDEVLRRFFANATALIIASQAEGFGLPLIEASSYDLPIIARDIPIFREVADGHAFFFEAEEGHGAADAIRSWLALPQEERPRSRAMPRATWTEATQSLVELMLGRRIHLRSSSPPTGASDEDPTIPMGLPRPYRSSAFRSPRHVAPADLLALDTAANGSIGSTSDTSSLVSA